MRGRGKKSGKNGGADEELNLARFDNDLVLRVNVSSFADRLAIAELAEVQSPIATLSVPAVLGPAFCRYSRSAFAHLFEVVMLTLGV